MSFPIPPSPPALFGDPAGQKTPPSPSLPPWQVGGGIFPLGAVPARLGPVRRVGRCVLVRHQSYAAGHGTPHFTTHSRAAEWTAREPACPACPAPPACPASGQTGQQPVSHSRWSLVTALFTVLTSDSTRPVPDEGGAGWQGGDQLTGTDPPSCSCLERGGVLTLPGTVTGWEGLGLTTGIMPRSAGPQH